VVQRRGVHVSPLKIGSRGAENVFGGILGIHAVLRREFEWGNLKMDFFGFWLRDPRGAGEEGGPLVFTLCVLGEFMC
jgi:hypothetical protein